MADCVFAMKLLNERCLECSIRAMFCSVIDRFNQGPFLEQNFVGYAHQGIFHVVLDLGDKLYAVREKILEESLADISLVII